MIKFIDLFSGIGGLRLGLERGLNELGIEYSCTLSADINKSACETYHSNFGVNPLLDVETLDPQQIDDFDLLLAGFPCQPFSYAGNKKGFGDTRGTLFFDIERILKVKKPKYILLENVRGLLTHNNGQTIKTVNHTLKNIGYQTEIRILNSCEFGVPQNRVRLYILGVLNSDVKLDILSSYGPKDSHSFNPSSFQQNLFSKTNIRIVNDILEDNPKKKYDCSPDFRQKIKKALDGDLNKIHGYRLIDYRGGNSLHSWDLGIKGTCSIREREFMNMLINNRRKKKFGIEQDGKKLTKDQILSFYPYDDFDKISHSLIDKGYLKKVDLKFDPVCGNMSFEVFKFLDPKKISVTLTSADTGRLGVFHNKKLRRITPREAARLQGFPDDFKCHVNDQQSYKQFGNSVSVPVIKELTKNFFENNHN